MGLRNSKIVVWSIVQDLVKHSDQVYASDNPDDKMRHELMALKRIFEELEAALPHVVELRDYIKEINRLIGQWAERADLGDSEQHSSGSDM